MRNTNGENGKMKSGKHVRSTNGENSKLESGKHVRNTNGETRRGDDQVIWGPLGLFLAACPGKPGLTYVIKVLLIQPAVLNIYALKHLILEQWGD